MKYRKLYGAKDKTLNIIRLDLEKADKYTYPKYDSAMYQNIPLQNNLKIEILLLII